MLSARVCVSENDSDLTTDIADLSFFPCFLPAISIIVNSNMTTTNAMEAIACLSLASILMELNFKV